MSNSLSGNDTVLFGPEPSPGDRLGNYILDRKLGSGGMGQVWKAIHEPTGKPYAIKLLPPIIASNPDAWDQVRRNFDIIENLNHPHICAVKVLDRDPKYGPYLVMAHVEGMTLNMYRQGRTFTPEQVAALLKPVAEALDFAHSRKVIHRDIKHENIMVVLADDSQTIVDTYVIDFGLAAESRTVVTQFSQQSAPLAGTLRYMAPELWRGRPPVPASDQYALAVIAYELLAEYFPIDGVDRGIMREAVLNETVEAIRHIPSDICVALIRGLAKEPQMRAIDCREYISLIDKSCRSQPKQIGRAQVLDGGSFDTLQAAIDVAPTGSTIRIDSGEHTIATVVSKEICIESQDASMPARLIATDATAFQIEKSGSLTLKDVSLKSCFSDAYSMRMRDAGVGIECANMVLDGGKLSLERCALESEHIGILARNGGTVRLDSCECSTACESVHAEDCREVVALRTSFRSNAIHTLQTTLTVMNCRFHDEEKYYCNAIRSSKSRVLISEVVLDGIGAIRLDKCEVDASKIITSRSGISVTGPSITLSSIRVTGGGIDIDCTGIVPAHVSDCHIDNGTGWSVRGSVLLNHVSAVKCDHGICMGKGKLTVRGSRFSDNRERSLFFLGDGQVEAFECEFVRSGDHGVHMWNSTSEAGSEGSTIALMWCKVEGNQKDGIFWTGKLEAIGCEISNNFGWGATTWRSETGSRFESCVFKGNFKGALGGLEGAFDNVKIVQNEGVD